MSLATKGATVRRDCCREQRNPAAAEMASSACYHMREEKRRGRRREAQTVEMAPPLLQGLFAAHSRHITSKMGRGCHGHGHSDDDDAGGTPYDQSVEEMDFLRSACAAAQRGQTDKLRAMLDRKPESLNWVRKGLCV